MKRQKSYLFKNTVLKKGNETAKTVFSGPGELGVGPAPEFEGSPETLNPEEMFVAAINNCLMTTFFYFVRKSNIEVLSYYSDAKGQVEKQADGFRFTNVQVQAEVTLARQEFAEQVRQFGDLAEKYCLVSRSVNCPVQYELEVRTTGKK
jgi:organic hydroperoxide reductase OsmC/OhrA